MKFYAANGKPSISHPPEPRKAAIAPKYPLSQKGPRLRDRTMGDI
jgi:hypothetical protein